MAFTGTAVVKKVSDKKIRITGLSLAAGASGDIGLVQNENADVPLTAPMGPAVLNSLVSALNGGYPDGMVGHMVAAQCKVNGVELKK